MLVVANFEVRTDCSVVNDELVFRIAHPSGLYRARIQNIRRADFSEPFLLAVHVYFDVESLDVAREVANDHLADLLNNLTLVTSSEFHRHRIRSIVEATPGLGMRSVLMW